MEIICHHLRPVRQSLGNGHSFTLPFWGESKTNFSKWSYHQILHLQREIEKLASAHHTTPHHITNRALFSHKILKSCLLYHFPRLKRSKTNQSLYFCHPSSTSRNQNWEFWCSWNKIFHSVHLLSRDHGNICKLD